MDNTLRSEIAFGIFKDNYNQSSAITVYGRAIIFNTLYNAKQMGRCVKNNNKCVGK